MDFFASQELARKNTRKLIVMFLIAIAVLVVAVYILVTIAFFGLRTYSGEELGAASLASNFRLDLFTGISAGVCSLIGAGSAYKIASLRGGGENVASLLGGRKLPTNSSVLEERRILNIVEEMALAAGTPVPPVYILDDEDGINAFAAGFTTDDAVVGLNRGTIETLNRDELQGVVAHEFSHILNGDMRMSIRMIGILHGIQLLAMIGYSLLRGAGARHRRSSRDDSKGAAAILVLAIGLLAIGWIGVFFARLIKASVSRQREYLADASAVQFTRNPEGIAGALKMIGAQSSQINNPLAEEASHMFFGSMFGNRGSFFATHPPLDDRISRIEPRFDGDYMGYAERKFKLQQRQQEADRRREEREQEHQNRTFGMGRNILGGFLDSQFPIDPLILIAGIGNPDQEDVVYSEIVVDRIPDVLVDASRDVFDARCIVFVSLLNAETTIRRAQLHALANNEGQATIDRTIELMEPVDQLEARFRLPVFEILQGTLTGMSPEQFESFRKSVNLLVDADQHVDFFEFFLRHHLMVHLDRRFGTVKPPRVKIWAINPLKNEICRLLAVLVRVGHADATEAHKAWDAAMASLGKSDWDKNALGESINADQLGLDIARVNTAAPVIKKKILTAMVAAIAYDKQVTVEEAEMFRAMSESLDCPVPPVMANAPTT